ncbi:glycoside hydrolase family 25 protein [Amycolatopsis magusensis]|uniref:glycoside hydrolase family 25 protein n=1 Tax=Amycolatopsis magusensis TaxID=882444 RepID=UPI003C307687
MVLFGLDISHHQGNRPQSWFNQVAAEGCAYVILKATQSSGFVDSRFHENLAKTRAAGMIALAYHYQQAGVSAAAQVANIRRVVPRDVPVIPDVEGGSGNIALTREIVRLLQDQNYRVPFSYIPRWYWQQIGQPSLVGLPPLWSSRYPDNAQGSIADEYADVPARYWDGYGGLGVALLQFSSSGRVAGYAPLDLNAFRGTRQEFAALLSSQSTPTPIPTNPDLMEENSMELTEGKEQSKTLVVREAAKELVVSRGFEGLTVHHIKFFGPTPEKGAAELAAYGEQVVDAARPYVKPVAAGAVTAEVFYTLVGSQHGAVAAFR